MRGLVFAMLIALLTGCGQVSQSTKQDVAAFAETIRMYNRAFELVSNRGGTVVYKVEHETHKKHLNLLEKCLDLARDLPDESLAELHEDLPTHYREKFVHGLDIYISSFEQEDREAHMQGQLLMQEFGEWYSQNVHR